MEKEPIHEGDEKYEQDVEKAHSMAWAEDPIRKVIGKLPEDAEEAKTSLLRIAQGRSARASRRFDESQRLEKERLRAQEEHEKRLIKQLVRY